MKTGLAELPEGSSWRHLIGVAFLAGIGFTMALFARALLTPSLPRARPAGVP